MSFGHQGEKWVIPNTDPPKTFMNLLKRAFQVQCKVALRGNTETLEQKKPVSKVSL